MRLRAKNLKGEGFVLKYLALVLTLILVVSFGSRLANASVIEATFTGTVQNGASTALGYLGPQVRASAGKISF